MSKSYSTLVDMYDPGDAFLYSELVKVHPHVLACRLFAVKNYVLRFTQLAFILSKPISSGSRSLVGNSWRH